MWSEQIFHCRAHSTDTTSVRSFLVFLYCFLSVMFGLTWGMLVKCPAISRSSSAFHRVVIKVHCECGRWRKREGESQNQKMMQLTPFPQKTFLTTIRDQDPKWKFSDPTPHLPLIAPKGVFTNMMLSVDIIRQSTRSTQNPQCWMQGRERTLKIREK